MSLISPKKFIPLIVVAGLLIDSQRQVTSSHIIYTLEDSPSQPQEPLVAKEEAKKVFVNEQHVDTLLPVVIFQDRYQESSALDTLLHYGLVDSLDRKSKREDLIAKHPLAGEHTSLMERSYFLQGGLQNFKAIHSFITDVLQQCNRKDCGSYDVFMRLARNITHKYAQSKKNNIPQTHLFPNKKFFQTIIKANQIHPSWFPILFPGNQDPSIGYHAYTKPDSIISRNDTLKRGNRQIVSTHLGAKNAYEKFKKEGYEIVSSQTGHLEDGTTIEPSHTSTQGTQPIVFDGLKLLFQLLQETYQINDLGTPIIRGGTEPNHFFGKHGKGIIGGVPSSTLEKRSLAGKYNSSIQQTIRNLWLIFSVHGYGTSVDLGIGTPESARAIEDLLDKGASLDNGYQMIYLGKTQKENNDIYLIYQKHGKDYGYHFHLGFTPGDIVETSIDKRKIAQSKEVFISGESQKGLVTNKE